MQDTCRQELTYHIHPMRIDRVDANYSLHGIVRFPREIIQVEPDYVLPQRRQYDVLFDILNPE
jgi:hypothetical protein